MDASTADTPPTTTSSPFSVPQRTSNVMDQPAPISSSPAAPSSTNFAFLVHSQDTIPNNLPPDVDNKPLARQRRRRTSPEDQIILEEEFLKDSKPDKAARTRIVERVALGEKEVQIWFQNRRQSSRRKSRPLMPHEIETHLQSKGSQSPLLEPSSSTLSDDATIEQSLSRSSSDDMERTKTEPMSDPASVIEDVSEQPMVKREDQEEAHVKNAVMHEDTTTAVAQSVAPAQPCSIPATPAQTFPATFEPSSSALPSSNAVFASSIFSSAIRPMLSSDLTIPSSVPRPAPRESSPPAAKSLKRVRSSVRLSMTSDGGAKILGPDESSPSPPKLIQPAPFRNSFSGAGKVSSFNDSIASSQGSNDGFSVRRIPSGRSRDSRAWEFWCDSEARNGLMKKAQQAQKGSAADAIGFLRSNSSKGPLLPSANKASFNLNPRESHKRLKLSHRSEFQRTSSAVGRLEASVDKENTFGATKVPKGSASFTAMSVSSSDSDKENEDPVPEQIVRRRPGSIAAKSNRRRPVLGESHTAPTLTKTTDTIRRDKKEKRVLSSKFVSPDDDDEVREFMSTGRQSKAREDMPPPATPAPAAEEDLGAVEGLLSLSQGNWR